jgi:hypothetical protein
MALELQYEGVASSARSPALAGLLQVAMSRLCKFALCNVAGLMLQLDLQKTAE